MNSKRRNFRLTFAVAAVFLTAILLLLVNVTGNLRGVRVDMTSDGLFTMTPAAVNILQELPVPVQVKLYITPVDKMPTRLRNLERDITEQLRNFEQVSQGMIEFSVHDPQDDAQMQQELAAKGIQPFQIQSVEKDEIGVKLIWSALTIAYKDKPEEILPQVLPQSLAALEQDIIGPIHRLTRERTPRVAYFGPQKVMDPQMAMMYMQQGMQPPAPQDQFTMIGELLGQGHYEAVPVQLTADSTVPDDVDLLIVMGLAALNERQVWEINQTLIRGVPVIMGVQAHEYDYSPARTGGWTVSGRAVGSGLEPMLEFFGLGVGHDHFMDTSMETIDLPREVNLGGLRMQTREPVRLPMQIRVTESQMLQDSPLVNRIGSLFYLWGTPVRPQPARLAKYDLLATGLINSSPRSWETPWQDGPMLPSAFDPPSDGADGSAPLAVLVAGQFPDSFVDSGVPDWPTAAGADTLDPETAGQPTATADPRPGQLLVIGSAKMFDDNIIQAPQNALLLLNAVDYLVGSRDLLAIRAKILTRRVIRPVTDTEKLVWRVVVVLLVPVLLAGYGFVRAGVRRREAAAYRQMVRRTGATRKEV
ncbi:hypothetical protein DRQ50_02500 [bacterium]|nr:MAG: hypothetical protein DRQ50_02500 [bacterium]